jgi:hypothetical protein
MSNKGSGEPTSQYREVGGVDSLRTSTRRHGPDTMAISNVEKLGQVQTAAGLLEEAPYNCQIAQFWPFMGIDGQAISYASKDQIPIAYTNASTNPAQELASTASSIVNHTDSPDVASGASPTFKLGELATRYVIPYSQQDRYRTPNDLNEVEAKLAQRRLLYRYFSRIGGYGSAADGAILGLRSICDPSQVVDLTASGLPGPFTLRQLDEAYHLVTDGGGRPNAIMSHSRARRTWLQALYAAGIQPEYLEFEFSDPVRGTATVSIPAWHGTPWFVNDLIEVENSDDPDTATSPVFFLELGDTQQQGLGRGVTGIIPRARLGDMFIHRESTDLVATAGQAGGPKLGMDCIWPVGLAVGSKSSLGILQNFSFVVPFVEHCIGVKVSVDKDGHYVWENVYVYDTGCEECCDPPTVTANPDPTLYPTVECGSEGETPCFLHARQDDDGTTTYWCCPGSEVSCLGVVVTPADEEGVSWWWEQVEVDDTGCEECCDPPAVVPNIDPTIPPEANCAPEGEDACFLHAREEDDGSTTYWCCENPPASCVGVKVTQIDSNTWEWEEVAIEHPGCEDCCDPPTVIPNADPTQYPTVVCGSTGCLLHAVQADDGSTTYWCCSAEVPACLGVEVTWVNADGVKWAWEQIAIGDPGCESCCGAPIVVPNADPTIAPSVVCPSDGIEGCELHAVEVGATTTYWCCPESVIVECNGVRVWQVSEDSWDWEDVSVPESGCTECCAAPTVTPNDGGPPTITCGDGCHLHSHDNGDGSFTYWCCVDE